MPVNVRFFGNLVDQFGAERVLGLSRSQHFEHRILRHHHERVLLGVVLGLLHRDQFDVRRPVGRLEMSLDVGLQRTLVVAETAREPPQAVTLEMLQQGWDVLELLGAVVTVELDLIPSSSSGSDPGDGGRKTGRNKFFFKKSTKR